MKAKEIQEKIEQAELQSQLAVIERRRSFDAINAYIGFATEKFFAFGATGVGLLEYMAPEVISFVALSSNTSLIAAGAGLGLLGGPKVQEMLRRIIGRPDT